MQFSGQISVAFRYSLNQLTDTPSNLITIATRRSHQYLIPNNLHQLPLKLVRQENCKDAIFLSDFCFCFDIHLTNSYLEEATDGRTNTYPQNSAPTFLKLVRPENCRDVIFLSNLITNATRRSHQYLTPNTLHQLLLKLVRQENCKDAIFLSGLSFSISKRPWTAEQILIPNTLHQLLLKLVRPENCKDAIFWSGLFFNFFELRTA